jgi:hypothetical protein
MAEFLSDFIIHCLSKDMNNRLNKNKDEEVDNSEFMEQFKFLNED